MRNRGEISLIHHKAPKGLMPPSRILADVQLYLKNIYGDLQQREITDTIILIYRLQFIVDSRASVLFSLNSASRRPFEEPVFPILRVEFMYPSLPGSFETCARVMRLAFDMQISYSRLAYFLSNYVAALTCRIEAQ